MLSSGRIKNLIVLCSVLCNVWAYADSSEYTVKAQDIQKRFYLIQRLDKPLRTLFSHVCKNPACIECLIINDSRFCFKHPVIKNELHEMALLHSIEPMYKVWNDILSYKYIDDDLFLQEAIAALIMMYKNLLAEAKTNLPLSAIHKDGGIGLLHDSTDIKYQKNLSTLLFEHNKLNTLCRDCENNDLDFQVTTMASLLDKNTEPKDFVASNIMRFYTLKRLIKPIYLLSCLSSSNGTIINAQALSMQVKELVRCIDILPFKHSQILKTIDLMRSLGSINPLFTLWKRINAYEFIDDELIIREFGQLLIIIYNACILSSVTRYVPLKVGDNILQNILVLYQRVSALPIIELLMTVEELVERFESIVHDYQLNDQSISWQTWIKNYWWTAPVAVVALVFTYTKMFFGRHILQPRISKNNAFSSSDSVNRQVDKHETLLEACGHSI